MFKRFIPRRYSKLYKLISLNIIIRYFSAQNPFHFRRTGARLSLTQMRVTMAANVRKTSLRKVINRVSAVFYKRIRAADKGILLLLIQYNLPCGEEAAPRLKGNGGKISTCYLKQPQRWTASGRVGTYNGNGGGQKTVKFSGLDDITRRDLISDYKRDSRPPMCYRSA